ncbi:MAG: NAD(+) diphosphatase [Marinibacterium sp.]
MRQAENVTFGGAGIDRAAHWRGDATALNAARTDPAARAVLLWRGKPMVATAQGEPGDQLVAVPLNHPVISENLGQMREQPIFLGRDATGPVFAADLSAWEPDDLEPGDPDRFLDTSLQRHPAVPGDFAFAELRQVMARLSAADAEYAATARALFNWHASHRFCARCGEASDVSQAGWQRLCPACGAHHFPRTDPVVIMLITHGSSVLIGRSLGWPEGMFSLLAGFVEPGETLEAAVRREVFEEAGIEVGEVGYLASQPWPFPASLMVGCHGRAKGREITVDPVEIEDALWVTKSELMQAFAGEHPVIKPAREGAIARFILHNWLADTLD